MVCFRSVLICTIDSSDHQIVTLKVPFVYLM